MSSRNVTVPNGAVDSVEERVLAAATRVLASGRRPTISELARLAGVSRPTIYRYFVDGEAVIRALWERELRLAATTAPDEIPDRTALVQFIVTVADHVASNDSLARTFVAEPSLLARYIFDHLGTGQRLLLRLLTDAIRSLQRGGTVRAGKPADMAAMTLLIAQSAIQSRVMISEHMSDAALRRELVRALDGYLKP